MSYSKEVYDEAAEEMEKRKLLSEQELDSRRVRFYAACPRAEKIERELARISVSAGKAVLGGADVRTQLEQLRDKSLALQNELDGLIRSKGLPSNYLEQWYQCEKCSDTGYIDGKMCSCMKTLLRKTAYEQLNQISPLSLCSFDSFSLDYYPKTSADGSNRIPYNYMGAVLKFCKRYASEFSQESHSLIFQGGSGLGKTHLSLSIAQSVIERGYGVIYVSAPAILSKIEEERFKNNYEEKGMSERLLTECDLLILDDLGTEFQTKYTTSTIYNIINTRLSASHPTIISTNLTLEEIQKLYTYRMVSRIIGMLDRIEFIGNDVRQLRRKERKK